jgi:hypothetical protein
VVGLRVHRHGTRAVLRFDVRDYAELIGRILVDNGEEAIFARGECQVRLRIEATGVSILADLGRRNLFAGVGIHDAITLLSLQPMKTRRVAVSMAIPEGPLQPASGYL